MRPSSSKPALSAFDGFGLLTIVLAAGACADVDSERELQGLQGLGRADEIAVIVTMDDRVDLRHFADPDMQVRRQALVRALRDKADRTQQPLMDHLRRRGVRRLKQLWGINGLSFVGRGVTIEEIASWPGVADVRLDSSMLAASTDQGGSAPAEYNLDLIGAPTMWAEGHTGAGVVVASVDTGVDAQHPDLMSRWRGGANSWFDPHGEHATPHDAAGHGTQVTSLIVGGNAGGTAIGVAPGATWIGVKIFDDSGSTTLSTIHQGMQWLLDPDDDPATDDAPNIVNSSWGFSGLTNTCFLEFEADIQLLKTAGIAVVFSAGNQGPAESTSVSPADNPSGFAVGAVDDLLSTATSSSRGPSACDGTTYPEVVAPGVSVKAADLTFGGVFPNSYAQVTGTSFAAPHVAGAMALLLSAVPGATVSGLEQALEDGALDLDAPGPDNVSGYGLISLAAAYQQLSAGPSCTDADGDGYAVEGASCGDVDCNDNDATIHPGACDIKRDGIDQDCDGLDRLAGGACSDVGGSTSGSEGQGKTCSDGVDNDNDGLLDCADPDCSQAKACK